MSEGFRVNSGIAIGRYGTDCVVSNVGFTGAGGTVNTSWSDSTLVSMAELRTTLARMEEQFAKLEELVMQMYDHPLMPGGQQVLQDFENEDPNTN